MNSRKPLLRLFIQKADERVVRLQTAHVHRDGDVEAERTKVHPEGTERIVELPLVDEVAWNRVCELITIADCHDEYDADSDDIGEDHERCDQSYLGVDKKSSFRSDPYHLRE